MERILLLLEVQPDGTLPKAAFEAVERVRTLACALKGAVWSVGLVGGEVRTAGETLGSCGAGKFYVVSGDEFRQPRYASDAAAAEAICRADGATLVAAPATSRWSRALPGVAQRMGGVVDTHVTGIDVADDGEIVVRRPYYRQRIDAAQSRTRRPWILLLDGGSGKSWSGAPAECRLEAVATPGGFVASRTTVAGIQAPQAEEQTIRPDAALLFVAGAGWTKKQADGQVHAAEAGELILDFVRHSKCSLGSSKSLVDLAGEGHAVLPFLTHLHQVGQTGSTPRHPKGLATCCHGEEPHVVGWRFINDRRAVNLDPNCGWARGKADVLYVADAFAVMRELRRLMGS